MSILYSLTKVAIGYKLTNQCHTQNLEGFKSVPSVK